MAGGTRPRVCSVIQCGAWPFWARFDFLAALFPHTLLSPSVTSYPHFLSDVGRWSEMAMLVDKPRGTQSEKCALIVS